MQQIINITIAQNLVIKASRTAIGTSGDNRLIKLIFIRPGEDDYNMANLTLYFRSGAFTFKPIVLGTQNEYDIPAHLLQSSKLELQIELNSESGGVSGWSPNTLTFTVSSVIHSDIFYQPVPAGGGVSEANKYPEFCGRVGVNYIYSDGDGRFGYQTGQRLAYYLMASSGAYNPDEDTSAPVYKNLDLLGISVHANNYNSTYHAPNFDTDFTVSPGKYLVSLCVIAPGTYYFDADKHVLMAEYDGGSAEIFHPCIPTKKTDWGTHTATVYLELKQPARLLIAPSDVIANSRTFNLDGNGVGLKAAFDCALIKLGDI